MIQIKENFTCKVFEHGGSKSAFLFDTNHFRLLFEFPINFFLYLLFRLIKIIPIIPELAANSNFLLLDIFSKQNEQKLIHI